MTALNVFVIIFSLLVGLLALRHMCQSSIADNVSLWLKTSWIAQEVGAVCTVFSFIIGFPHWLAFQAVVLIGLALQCAFDRRNKIRCIFCKGA